MDYASFINGIWEYQPYEDRVEPQKEPPTVRDFVSSAIKLELAANAIRFGLGGFLGVVGATTPISATFDRSRQAFRMRTLWAGGMIPKLIESLDPVRRKEYKAAAKEFFSKPNRSLLSTLRRDFVRDPALTKHFSERPYDFLIGTEKNYTKFREKYTFGFLGNRIVAPADFHNTMRDILPDDVYRAQYKKLDKVFNKYLTALRQDKAAMREFESHVARMAGIRDVAAKGGISLFEVTSGTKTAQNSLLKMVPALGRPIARVSLLKEKIGVRIPWKLRAATGGQWKLREANAVHTAFIRTLEEVAPQTAAKVAEGGIEAGIVKDYAMRYVNRVGYARFAKLSAAAYWLPQLAVGVVGAAARTPLSLPYAVARKIEKVRNPEFGRDIMMNSRMATERQRAVMAIQDAQYNARYLLGNEASLYH